MDRRVASAVQRWSEARRRGESLAVETVCEDCPELVEVVRAHVRRLEMTPVAVERPSEEARGTSTDPAQTEVVPPLLGSNHYDGGATTIANHEEEEPGPPEGEYFRCLLEFSDLQPHAEGGLGEVFAATDGNTHRRVALKTVLPDLADEPYVAERLLTEAEVTAKLEHPGVVPVFGVGHSSEGRPFYVMRFVEGRTLEEAIAEHHRPGNKLAGRQGAEFHSLLTHFVSVCKTIAYAHNRGIIHRDVKPQNVLLGRFGETIVVDWGLATSVERAEWARASGERTLSIGAASDTDSSAGSGSGGGTPFFMSPEQARLEESVGPASDVYNLGATLYKIVTGENPIRGGRVREIMKRVERGEFDPPSKHNPRVSKALEAICLKAMSLEPRDRYATALALADDVERYLADDVVTAYSEPVSRKVARWARRHRTATQAALLLLSFVTLGGLAAAWVLGQHAVREGKLHAVAAASAHREHALREQTLTTSAEFAARSLANRIDVRWRVLEREAAAPRVAAILANVNEATDDESRWEPLQEWLDERGAHHAADVPCRALFVNAIDGTQVARFPSHDEDGERYTSLGGRYAFRDYFHGRGRDFEKDHVEPPFQRDVHVSAVHESTNDGALSVVFGVPIRDPETGKSLGILSMSVSIGEFADLDVTLPAGQSVLLVDTKQYSLHRRHPAPHEEWCEGLVLHHDRLEQDLRSRARLPRVPEASLERLLADAASTEAARPGERLVTDYRDPLADDPDTTWLAAFAPVVAENRPAPLRGTGWYVIVQQEQPRNGFEDVEPDE